MVEENFLCLKPNCIAEILHIVMFSNDLCIYKKEKIVCGEVRVFSDKLDCEQPLFSFRFSKGSARARERWTAKPRDARSEGGSPRRKKSFFCRTSPVSRLQSRAWSFTCVRRFARRTKKKERLLVLY